MCEGGDTHCCHSRELCPHEVERAARRQEAIITSTSTICNKCQPDASDNGIVDALV